MGDTVTFSIRIEKELKQQLEELAKTDQRSLNNMIILILSRYVREHGGNSD